MSAMEIDAVSPGERPCWDLLPSPAVACLAKVYRASACFRILCKHWLDAHDGTLEELTLKEWPDDLAALERLLARMPSLTKLDLTQLGPDPSGSNRLDTLVSFLKHKTTLKDIRLERTTLPVVELGFPTSVQSHEASVVARVSLPPALTTLTGLETLHVERSYRRSSKVDLILDACSALYNLPSLKHLHLDSLQKPAVGGGFEGGLSAFTPCLPNLEGLSLLGPYSYTPDLEYLLPACEQLQQLELNNVLGACEVPPGSELTEAEVVGNILQGLTALEQLTRLKLVAYSMDEDGEQVQEHLAALQQLQHLDLGDSMWKLPSSYTALQQLTYLHMPADSYPGEELGILTALQVLKTSDALATSGGSHLPDSISRLTQLRELQTARHGIMGLPMAMAHCRQLSSLDVGNCGIQGWPDVLRHLTALRELRAGMNADMCALMMHDAFEGLEGLTLLDLGLTDMRQLPSSFTRLTQLQQLDLNGNALSSLPEGLALPALQKVDLGGNCFSEVPPQLQHSLLLQEVKMKQQQPPESLLLAERRGRLICLLYSHARDLPAWLLQLPELRSLQVNEHKLVKSAVLAQLRARWQGQQQAVAPRGLQLAVAPPAAADEDE